MSTAITPLTQPRYRPHDLDWPLIRLRARAKEFIRQQKAERLDWEYYNTFLGRRVLRHRITGEFKIIGGQVVVTL